MVIEGITPQYPVLRAAEQVRNMGGELGAQIMPFVLLGMVAPVCPAGQILAVSAGEVVLCPGSCLGGVVGQFAGAHGRSSWSDCVVWVCCVSRKSCTMRRTSSAREVCSCCARSTKVMCSVAVRWKLTRRG